MVNILKRSEVSYRNRKPRYTVEVLTCKGQMTSVLCTDSVDEATARFSKLQEEATRGSERLAAARIVDEHN